MDIDQAVTLTQDRLAREGGTMGELLGHFRRQDFTDSYRESGMEPHPRLRRETSDHIGRPSLRLRAAAARSQARGGLRRLGGQRNPIGGILPRARTDRRRRMTPPERSPACSGKWMPENSPLRAIVGRKVMLEYDIGSAREEERALPGMFLRPGERPILGARGQVDDVGLVVDALVSCVGWRLSDAERENVERAYLAQPGDTRMDSYGIFPSRSRAIRLAIMGFKSRREMGSYLENTGWPGRISAVDSVISRFQERVNIVRTGANLDVREEGVGPTLGLTLIVKQRYTKDSRYWLDGLTDWDPFLEALSHEDLVVPEKLRALAGWVSRPTTLFGKSGRFVLLRGIHHIKLVISGNRLRKAKAYVFMVLSGAVSS